MMLDSERIAIIRHGLDTAFWRDWLQPSIAIRVNQMLKGLAASRADDDDIKRGWIQALGWVLALPQSQLDAMARTEHAAQTEDEERRQDAYRAEFGFRSPYRQSPEVGETSTQQPEPPTAQAQET